MMASNLSSISMMKRVEFSSPIWHPLIWILSLSMTMDLSNPSRPYLLWRIENPPKKVKSPSTAWLTVTILLVWVFILLWVVLYLSLYAYRYCILQWLVTFTILYSTVYGLVCFVTLFWSFLSCFGCFCLVLYVVFSLIYFGYFFLFFVVLFWCYCPVLCFCDFFHWFYPVLHGCTTILHITTYYQITHENPWGMHTVPRLHDIVHIIQNLYSHWVQTI